MDIQQITRNQTILVDINGIQEKPGPYSMSFGFDPSILIRSINEIGLINPPFVVKNEKGYLDVVIGFRRISALRSLNMKMIPCVDLSGLGFSKLELLQINLFDNLSIRKFNEIEIAMTLKRLSNYVSKEDIQEKYMPLLGVSNRKEFDTYLAIEGLEHKIKKSLSDCSLSRKIIKLTIGIDNKSSSIIFQWIRNLKLNFNQQIQFFEYLMDLSIAKENTIFDILSEDSFEDILRDNRSNNPQKVKRLLNLLRSMRFPALSLAEKRFQKQWNRLGFSNRVRIVPPPFFEAPDYRLELLFKDGNELKSLVDSIANTPDIGEIGNLWEVDE